MAPRICPVILLSLLFGPAAGKAVKPFSAADGNGRVCTELRYTDRMGVPMVEVAVGKNRYRFILDTGASITCITDRLARTEGLEAKHSRYRFKNLSGRLSTVTLPGLTMGGVVMHGEEAVVLDADNTIFRVLGIDGIIGGSTLEHFVVTFDSRARRITVSEHADAPGPARWERFRLWRNLPLLRLGLTDRNGCTRRVSALFDSGNGTGSVVVPDPKEFGKYIASGIVTDAEEGVGMTSRMIGGLGESSCIYRGRIADMALGGGRLTGVPVMTGGMAYMLLCWKITELGTLTIDYPKKRYSFTPYEGAEAWSMIPYPVMTAVENGRMIVASVWDEQLRHVISPGDVVVAIGETEIRNPDQTATPNIDEMITELGCTRGTVTILDIRGVTHILPAELFLP